MINAVNDEMVIATRHGCRVPIFEPDPQSIEIRDNAAGLARRFRWNAQSDMTVAQHSVNVSRRLGGHEAQWGLLHDAAEAYLLDVARPFKAHLMVRVPLGPTASTFELFEQFENRLLRAIGHRFGLAWPVPPAVHDADQREMYREARDLFGDPIAATKAYPERLEIVPHAMVENLFLRRFTELFREPV